MKCLLALFTNIYTLNEWKTIRTKDKTVKADMSSTGTDIELIPTRLNDQTLSPDTKCNNDDTGGPHAPKEDVTNKQSVNSPLQVQNNQQGNQGNQFYSPTSGNISQSEGMRHYPSNPSSPPGFPIGAFPASSPIDYQIMSTAPPLGPSISAACE